MFLESAAGRKKSPAFEVRWLNLCGFCLRPGLGFPGDDFRLEQARRVYSAGLTFANQVQCEIEWWIFWGRVAGGLNRNQQTDIYQRLAAAVMPRGGKKQQRINSSLLREMWRTAASVELLPIHTKTELGDTRLRRRRGPRPDRPRSHVRRSPPLRPRPQRRRHEWLAWSGSVRRIGRLRPCGQTSQFAAIPLGIRMRGAS